MITPDTNIELLTREEQQKLVALLMNGSDFVSLSTLQGYTTFLNEAGRKMVGIDHIEETRRPHTDYVMPAELEKLQEISKSLAESGRWSGIVELRHFKTGAGIPVHVNTMFVYDELTGTPNGRATIGRDLRPVMAAEEQQRKLFTLVDNGKDLMSILNMDGTNSYINKAGKNLLGILPGTPVSEIPISAFHTPEQLAFVESEILPSVMSTGRWSGRFAAKHMQTGEILPLENNCIRIDDPVTGEPLAVGAVMRDLRPEIEAEETIKESERRFRRMIMQAPLAIGILEGEQMKITSANEAILGLWGKDERVIGLNLMDAMPELEGQPFPQLLRHVYTTGESYYGFEQPAKIRRFSLIEDAYFNFVYSPIKEGGNDVTGIMVVATDVTTQVLAKKEIEVTEKRFQSLILEAPNATALYVGEDMIVEVANEAMIRLWGKDETVIGKKLEDALPELEGQPFLPLLRKVFATGEPYHSDMQSADLVIEGKLQTFWFNFTYKPLHDAEGKVYAILNMAVDITRQVQLQKQKDEFLGIASHELKTPVTTIKAYTQVLQRMMEERADTESATMLGRMDNQVNKLNNLISDLLDVTKIQAGKIRFNETSFELNELVQEVTENMRTIVKTHTLEVSKGAPAMVFADRERVEQVISNFISNAVKYSPKSDKVIINTKVEGDNVICSVQDFGIGIPQDQQAHIFEQFYRVSTNYIHRFSGLGLGLYIASEIVKRSGGDIGVMSKENEGSTFWFSLAVM